MYNKDKINGKLYSKSCGWPQIELARVPAVIHRFNRMSKRTNAFRLIDQLHEKPQCSLGRSTVHLVSKNEFHLNNQSPLMSNDQFFQIHSVVFCFVLCEQ